MNKLSWIAVLLLAPVLAVADDPLQRFIVHLETGEAWNAALPPGEQDSFAAHSANMKRLRDEGVILLGARYGDYGMLIVEARSEDALRATLEADPGVAAGIFTYRLEPISIFYPWRDRSD